MKTTDLFKTTSHKLNEGLSKTFGKKINFETFDNAQLEDVRNKLRTQVHQTRSNSEFNENLDNDAYHQAQWMLDAINAELAEREEQVAEGQDVDENTVRELLKKFDQDANEMNAYGDVNPETVIRHLEQGDVEEAIQTVMDAYAGPDGEEPTGNFESLLAELEDDFQAVIEHENDDFDFRQEYDDDPMDDMMDDINESQINEGEIDEASAIVTASTMIDKVSRWIEELSSMENDTLISLGDSIRDEIGAQQAKQFLSTTAPTIEEALNVLKTTRDEMSTALRVLTGEEQATDMLGAEEEVPAEEVPAEEVPAEEPVEDEFAAAEPAAGGIEPEGREQRESYQRSNNLMKILAG